jgi:uncharacterized protein (DUF2141 family)
MKKQILLYFFLAVAIVGLFSTIGCANIIPPLGGPKDTLPPVLVRSVPVENVTNFQGKNIVLEFNEYVTVDNPYQNVIISPTPKKQPLITGKLRDINIKIWDTLEPNTTYSFNFGNAIKDVNESNIYKNFTYVFSTGRYIDSLTLTGRVKLAESGKVDSTLIVLLHQNLDDSAVAKDKARYMAKLDGKGNFRFANLPPGRYNLFALKDEGFKKYTDNSILFAFAGDPITLGANNPPVSMFAFVGEKEKPKTGKGATSTPNPFAKKAAPPKEDKDNEKKEDKRLRLQPNLQDGQQDLLSDLKVTFSKGLKSFDSSKFILADAKYNPIPNVKLVLDSNRRTISISPPQPWQENVAYKLLLIKGVATDSAGNTNSHNDTIPFKTKPESAYGTISRLHFQKLDLSKHPVLLWYLNDVLVKSIPLTIDIWTAKLFEPGTYELRILYDANGNGKWDTGNYWKKIQPEKVFSIPQKIEIRPNIDREYEIENDLTP